MTDGRFGAPAGAFAQILNRTGLHGALAYLNGRTRHRFTGVYRCDPPMLRNLCLFDRENPEINLGGDTPMHETYCSLVLESLAPFATTDAGADERLCEHPARETVLSYCGVPLLADDGSSFGTLCHFDSRPRLVAQAELSLLETVAPLVMREIAVLTSAARAGATPRQSL